MQKELIQNKRKQNKTTAINKSKKIVNHYHLQQIDSRKQRYI